MKSMCKLNQHGHVRAYPPNYKLYIQNGVPPVPTTIQLVAATDLQRLLSGVLPELYETPGSREHREEHASLLSGVPSE